MRENIFDEIRKMREAIDRIFSRLWSERSVFPEIEELKTPEIWEPPVDIKETDTDIVIKTDLPGVSKDNIDIKISDDILEIKAEVKKKEEEKEEGYIRRERVYKSFYKKVHLPAKVDPEKADAEYKDGVLTIKLPKTEVKKPVKIEVK